MWWLAIAVLTTLKYLAQDLPFNLGWWGLTFPLGVFTSAILSLAHQLNVNFILNIGLSFAVILMILWIIVMVKTVKGMYQGHLFFSPCLKTLSERE